MLYTPRSLAVFQPRSSSSFPACFTITLARFVSRPGRCLLWRVGCLLVGGVVSVRSAGAEPEACAGSRLADGLA